MKFFSLENHRKENSNWVDNTLTSIQTYHTGLAEARVAALKEVISDFEQETQRMQLSEVLEEDHRCQLCYYLSGFLILQLMSAEKNMLGNIHIVCCLRANSEYVGKV